MKIAIYSRKSKYNDKSESIDSQIEFCKSFAYNKFNDKSIDYFIYKDEGFSGGNTDRPEYKRLIADIHKNKFDIIMSYKIDRISRSFIDFANLQQLLHKHNISIISASEGFDTSTPWGKSVLNILMVFAELERNNVSERIRDTMLHYARQGRWTGGLTPTGFKSSILKYTDHSGQTKKMTVLKEIPEETELIKTIFYKYSELKSLSELERWLKKNKFNTKKGNCFSSAAIRDILRNPVYAVADIEIYKYFNDLGAEICGDISDFNGEHSIITYNRFDKEKQKEKEASDWIIALGFHKGIIESELWLKIQQILKANSMVLPRRGTSDIAIFSGMIFCKKCGSCMRVKKGRFNKKLNRQEYYYVCSLKEKSHLEKCNIDNLTGSFIEEKFIYYMNKNFNELYKSIKITREDLKLQYQSKNSDTIEKLKKELDIKNNAIKNLVNQISFNPDSMSNKYLTSKIEELDKEVSELSNYIYELKKPSNYDFKSFDYNLKNIDSFNKIKSTKVKREILKSIIKNMYWDGNELYIFFDKNADF